MTEKAKPISFAKHFKIDKKKLAELGVFNPILNFDTKLFVEPLLLKKSSSPFIQSSFESYNNFFRNLLLLIKSSKEPNDKCWREAKRRINFPEYKETCIGYGSDSINGSGSGRDLNEKILQSAREIVDVAKDSPDIFLLLPLLEEGIGADIVSDMTQTIIDDDICKYTTSIMSEIGIQGTHRYVSDKKEPYMLPYNPYHKCPVKLLPTDILSNLPMADTFDDWITKVAGVNKDLRDGVNHHIGNTWFDANKSERKKSLLELIKSDKDFFFIVLKTLQDSTLEHYDIEKDYQGLRRWLEDSKKFITPHNFNKIQSIEERQEALSQAVEEIIMQFRNLIENEELWRIFWTEHGSQLKHVNELYSQMLFYMVSTSWLAAQDSNISVDRYLNKETKQIHYIFSVSKKCSLTVQIKHSDNFSGLEKVYEKEKGNSGFYIVINFNNEQPEQLRSIKSKEEPNYKIVEIYASAEESQTSFELDDIIIGFEGLEFEDSRYIKEKRKGGKKRHEKTEIIKNKIVKPMFSRREIIKGRSIKQRAANLNDKLSNLQEMNDDELSIFSNAYGLDLCILKDSVDYFSDDKEEQIYKWCLAIEKETA